MAVDSAQVEVAVTGAVYVGETDAAAPTSTGSATTGFADLGGISADGVVFARDRSTNDIILWQNAAVARTVVTESGITVTFTMVQTNPDTLALYWGAAVDDSDGSLIVVPSNTGGRKSFIFDYLDGALLRRAYIPQGEVTEVGEMTWQSGEPVGYEVTVAGYPSADIVNEDGQNGSAQLFFSDLIVP